MRDCSAERENDFELNFVLEARAAMFSEAKINAGLLLRLGGRREGIEELFGGDGGGVVGVFGEDGLEIGAGQFGVAVFYVELGHGE